MGLLNFLFPKVENTIKTIYDFFQLNIKELPDSSFIDEGYTSNSMGSEFQFFTSDLDYLECGIFNKIQISKFTEGGMNATFNSGISSTLNIAKLKELVNSLYRIYGNDSNGLGMFTDQDIKEYYGDIGSFRRSWIQKTPFIIVDANCDDNDISLSILGIENYFANNEKQKKSINDFFKTNLKELPDKRFNANGFVSSEKVAGFYSFDLTLDYLECGIFNEINVHQHPEGGMTVFFTSTDLLNVKLDTVKELVDSLFNLYGLDSDDKGKFTEQEKNEFYGHHESSLRSWINPELPFEFIDIEVDRENNEMSLTIIVSKVD